MSDGEYWTNLMDTFEAKWANVKECPFCGAQAAKLENGWRGKPTPHQFYWISCNMCGATGARGETPTVAVDNWDSRPTRTWNPLGPHSYVLPMQKYGHLLIYEDQRNVSFIDYMDGEMLAVVPIDLGHFRICRRDRVEK